MPEELPLIRVLVADDEPLARRTLRRLLDHDPQVQVVGEASGADVPAAIRSLEPDLLFLDIQMPQMDGFQVLAQFEPEELPMVIFVTAYDEYALQAFDLRALDYLIKPFTDRRLIEALGRAKELIQQRETESTQRRLLQLLRARLARTEERVPAANEADEASGGRHSRLAVRDGGRILLFQTHEVIWIEAAGSYSRLHTETGSDLVRGTLGALEEQLDPQRFFRIHRSAIVSLDRVKEVRHESHGDYIVVLRDGTELRLARSRKEEFELRVGLQ